MKVDSLSNQIKGGNFFVLIPNLKKILFLHKY